MRSRHAGTALLLTSSLVLVGAACGGDDDGGAIATTGTSAATTTTAAATTLPPALANAGTAPVSVPAGTERALLHDVRAAAHPGYDRIVFEFEGATPGYQVSYTDRPVTEDGSGDTVDVAGGAVLLVRMENASAADLSGPELRQTYTGPARIRLDGGAVTEVVRVGDFEGVLTWAIGVKAEAPFAVSTLSGPGRLVVDVDAG